MHIGWILLIVSGGTSLILIAAVFLSRIGTESRADAQIERLSGIVRDDRAEREKENDDAIYSEPE